MLLPCRNLTGRNTVVDLSGGDTQQDGGFRHGDTRAVSLIGPGDIMFITKPSNPGICECFSARTVISSIRMRTIRFFSFGVEVGAFQIFGIFCARFRMSCSSFSEGTQAFFGTVYGVILLCLFQFFELLVPVGFQGADKQPDLKKCQGKP